MTKTTTTNKQVADNQKDYLSREEISNEVETISKREEQRSALETPEGKNNGAKPAAYKNQRSSHP